MSSLVDFEDDENTSAVIKNFVVSNNAGKTVMLIQCDSWLVNDKTKLLHAQLSILSMNLNSESKTVLNGLFARNINGMDNSGLAVQTFYTSGFRDIASRADFSSFTTCSSKFKYSRIENMGFTVQIRRDNTKGVTDFFDV